LDAAVLTFLRQQLVGAVNPKHPSLS